ncbi:hypothetical protein V8F06_010112 [Rhypophila decipiens]
MSAELGLSVSISDQKDHMSEKSNTNPNTIPKTSRIPIEGLTPRSSPRESNTNPGALPNTSCIPSRVGDGLPFSSVPTGCSAPHESKQTQAAQAATMSSTSTTSITSTTPAAKTSPLVPLSPSVGISEHPLETVGGAKFKLQGFATTPSSLESSAPADCHILFLDGAATLKRTIRCLEANVSDRIEDVDCPSTESPTGSKRPLDSPSSSSQQDDTTRPHAAFIHASRRPAESDLQGFGTTPSCLNVSLAAGHGSWSFGILVYEMLCGYTPFWDGGSPMKIDYRAADAAKHPEHVCNPTERSRVGDDHHIYPAMDSGVTSPSTGVMTITVSPPVWAPISDGPFGAWMVAPQAQPRRPTDDAHPRRIGPKKAARQLKRLRRQICRGSSLSQRRKHGWMNGLGTAAPHSDAVDSSVAEPIRLHLQDGDAGKGKKVAPNPEMSTLLQADGPRMNLALLQPLPGFRRSQVKSIWPILDFLGLDEEQEAAQGQKCSKGPRAIAPAQSHRPLTLYCPGIFPNQPKEDLLFPGCKALNPQSEYQFLFSRPGNRCNMPSVQQRQEARLQ